MLEQILFIGLGLILFSLIFFSRGILIFFTIVCLALGTVLYPELKQIGSYARWLFFGLFCFHVFGDIFLGRTVRRIKFMDVLAIFFIIYAFLSSLYSAYPQLTLERSTTILVLYISVFWIIWKYAYERSPERVVYLILQTAALIFIAGYLLLFIGPHRPFLKGRFTGIFENPNTLGVFSAIILPLNLWQFLKTKKKTALFFFLLTLISLLLCVARASMNAAMIALGYLIYVRAKKYKPLIFFFSLSFILLLAWVIETLIKEHFLIYIRAETIPILGGRLEIWPVAIDLIMDKPIFGYGFGIEDKVVGVQKILLLKHAGAYIHNSYLGMLLQLGIIGFIIFFIPLFILLFKELSSIQDNPIPLLRYALRSSLISGLICCFYESWIYSAGNAMSFPFWIIVMLLIFYRYQDKEKNIPVST